MLRIPLLSPIDNFFCGAEEEKVPHVYRSDLLKTLSLSVFKLQKRALEGIPHIAFTLVCGAKLKSALWRIGANVKFVIRKKDGDRFVERNYPSNEFTFAAKTLADMVPWEEIDTTLGCSVSDPKTPIAFTIELHIDIVKSYGFRCVTRPFSIKFWEPSQEITKFLDFSPKPCRGNGDRSYW
ncbi:unnamed protein product [Haemonchus placei]|uniref:DUF223 domain-containing protein n=1 Tax=Haemonchus placei TaxID=6290 RepID=A0A0N4VY41_HAEPC|nr:unnamed protein product [Haemonchus placei]